MGLSFGVAFTTVGAILVLRRPDEPVGRTCLAICLALVAAVGLRGLAVAFGARPGTNLAFQTVLASAIDASPLTVAATALLVAALFQPLRRGGRATTFAYPTRNEVDLVRLAGETRRAAVGAVQPATAVVWLRVGAR